MYNKLKIPLKECGQIFHGKWIRPFFPRKEASNFYYMSFILRCLLLFYILTSLKYECVLWSVWWEVLYDIVLYLIGIFYSCGTWNDDVSHSWWYIDLMTHGKCMLCTYPMIGSKFRTLGSLDNYSSHLYI